VSRSIPELQEGDLTYHRTISTVQVTATYTVDDTADIPVDPTETTTDNQISFSSVKLNDPITHLRTRITLSKRWGIPLDVATATLACSTQTAVRNVFSLSERKVRKKAPWLQFPSIKGIFYVDSLFLKVPAIGGFKGGSLYTNGLGYDRFYPWVRKSDHADTHMLFINNVGLPQTLISDNAKEEVRGHTREMCTKYRINVKTTVPHSPWQNLAEASIRETKKTIRRTLRLTGAPFKLWAACAVWATGFRRLTASSIPQLGG
jgi:hypothetical protein